MAHQDAVDVRRGTFILFAVLAAWGLTVAALAAAGFYRSLYPPVIGPIIVMGVAAPVAAYASLAGFRRYVAAIGLRPLTAFHVWRIPAALLFFWYGAHDLLPPAFVRDAGWGDLIAGLMALGVTLLPESRGRYLAFHLFGLADLVVALATGLTLTLLGDPRMGGIATLPVALIPLFGVGFTGARHLLAFDLLRRGIGLRPAARGAAILPTGPRVA
jgi:hypothetical protein